MQQDLKSKDAAFQGQRIVLSQEIDSLKQQLADAKKTNQELDKAIEAQKRANLDTVSLHSRQEVDSNEARLQAEERFERAERELEQMRSEKLQVSERLWKLEKELADARLKVGQKDLEMKSMLEDAQVRKHQQAERELHVQEIQRLKNRLGAAEKQITDLMSQK